MTVATAAKQNTLSGAMALAFAQIEAATKDASNPHFKSKYADLGAVIGAVKPALIANDLFFTQHCHPSEDGVMVETVLGHAAGEEKSLGKLFVPANKRDAQGFGSALTYARRYALLTAFGVPTEDDDGNAAARSNGRNGNGGAKIDDNQWGALVQLIEANGADTKRFCQYLGVDSLRDIPASRYSEAVAALQAKAKKPEAGQ